MQQLAEVRVFAGQGLVAVGQRSGSADFDVVAVLLDALHVLDVADIDHHRQFAMELSDFQGQVGAAGQQAGLRVGHVEVGQVGDGQRNQAALVAAVQLGGLTRGDGFQLGDGLGFGGVELVRLLLAAGLLGGVDDRAVAGAAAQVAGQGLHGLGLVVAVAVLLQGEQRHDEAGGAEAALGTVAIHHRLLHGMQLALVLEVFHGDQLLAVQRRHEGQAGVQGAVADAVAVQLADDHGAGTAIARGAAFFGTGFADMLTQVVEHRDIGIEGMLGAQLPIE
ncbi:hypothetical protein D9M69_407270 [compost metagenome]